MQKVAAAATSNTDNFGGASVKGHRRPAEGVQWACAACTFLNSALLPCCELCDATRTTDPRPSPQAGAVALGARRGGPTISPRKRAGPSVGKEAKQAALERMLKKEQGIAAAATTAAAKSAAAAEREATRNQIQDYLSRFDDSAAFDRDVADVEPAARVACKQKGVSMRIAARQAAHSLTSIGEEMRQDEEEDKREEVHATAISEAPGSVQQLISASRKVVQKERARSEEHTSELQSP